MAVPSATPSAGLMSKSQRNAARATEKITIAFLFDATASRESTWRAAQSIQADMISEYASGSNVEVGIIVHRGSRVEVLGWFRDGESARRAMQQISCEGGITRILPGLDACLRRVNPKAIVMVGDCFEEDKSSARKSALALKDSGIPVHAFHESSDVKGEQAYKMIAELSGGAFVKFGPGMDLRALIKPLFVQIVEGNEAFNQMVASGDKGAKALADGGLLTLSAPK